MVFRKKIEPRCAYCANADSAGTGLVICWKKGVISDAGSCRSFRYNPLRRTPPRPAAADFSKYDDRDYSL